MIMRAVEIRTGSFHSVLKKEEIYLHTYQDTKEARRAIFEYIEGWYNRKRIHSAIGYITLQQKLGLAVDGIAGYNSIQAAFYN